LSFKGFQLSQIDLGDVSLRVRHGGSGPPLLLLHGFPETHMMWAKVAPDLARDFTVIAPDLRGYGGSSKPATTDDHADRRFAIGYWHWSFLAQAHPFPETLIGKDPETFFFRPPFRGILGAEEYEDYRAAVHDPAVVHGRCEDYRAGATYDRLLDEVDRGKKRISCPVQVLWGAKGAVGAWYDVLDVWRSWADDLRGEAIDCGHFIPEEKPAETVRALRRFFAEGL
jgi:pimeloyl-ACP methyl ester carboxylesterase